MNRHYGIISIVGLLGLSMPCATIADTWLIVNKDGSEFTSNTSNHRGYKMITRSWKGWHERKPSANTSDHQQIDQMIKKIALEKNIPTALIHAVISVESAYKPNAVSPMGATGLMQLMPETAKRYGVTDRKDVKQNIMGGVSYLSDLFIMFNNDLKLVLAAYNAGENAVKKYNNTIPPYRETQQYVKKVLARYHSRLNTEQNLAARQ